MYQYYYVNKKAQPNGDHEVHTETCSYLPSNENRSYLGYFGSCADAIKEAKKTYPTADGCFYCSNSCHKK